MWTVTFFVRLITCGHQRQLDVCWRPSDGAARSLKRPKGRGLLWPGNADDLGGSGRIDLPTDCRPLGSSADTRQIEERVKNKRMHETGVNRPAAHRQLERRLFCLLFDCGQNKTLADVVL